MTSISVAESAKRLAGTEEDVLAIRAFQEYAARRGPVLLRMLKMGNLTSHQWKELRAIKALCKCGFVDDPTQFATNGENCEICGRPIQPKV